MTLRDLYLGAAIAVAVAIATISYARLTAPDTDPCADPASATCAEVIEWNR